MAFSGGPVGDMVLNYLEGKAGGRERGTVAPKRAGHPRLTLKCPLAEKSDRSASHLGLLLILIRGQATNRFHPQDLCTLYIL